MTKYAIFTRDRVQIFLSIESFDAAADMLKIRDLRSREKFADAVKLSDAYVKFGLPEAKYLRAHLPFSSNENADTLHFRLIEEAATQQYPPAQYRLGAYFDNGDEVEKDASKAAALFCAAALRGHAHSQWIHGEDLLFGRSGVSADASLGLRFIADAARQKFVGALETLSNFYRLGLHGCDQDREKANLLQKQILDDDVIDY